MDWISVTQQALEIVPELQGHIARRHSGAASPTNGSANKLDPLDRAAHDWYRFVLSYPPHLVRRYLDEFALKSTDTVLDPFCGKARHLSELRPLLKPGAQLAYVVGDQASYLRVMIRTGELLADIAQGLGYRLKRIDLFRTRLATASREQLREEVVVLEWPGKLR